MKRPRPLPPRRYSEFRAFTYAAGEPRTDGWSPQVAAISRTQDAVLDGYPWNVHAMIFWDRKGWTALVTFMPTRRLRPADRARFDRSGMLQKLRRRLASLGYRGSWIAWERASDIGGSFSRRIRSFPEVRHESQVLNGFLGSL